MARCIVLGSGSIRGNIFGKKEDHTYNVPDGAIFVSIDRSGNATLTWDQAAKKAYVHAWVNGAVFGSNRISWTVSAWVRE